MRLILIRHGQTLWNQQKRIHGWLDSYLTDKARKKLQEINLPPLNNPIIFSSDLARAEHSAEIIANKFALSITLDSRLRERHFGVLQGKVIDKGHNLQKEWASYHQRYLNPISDVSEVESEVDFELRIAAFISDLPSSEKKLDVIIVGHGEWLRAFINIINNIPSWHYGAGVMENATPYIIEWKVE